ncbi:unnamed protein product [Closterium sp. NIES-64]|nr:unnamed protein product [Closterium sp. NIES-64]
MARSAPRLLPLGIALVLLAALTSRTSARSEASFYPSTVVTPKAGFTVPSFKFNFKFDFQRVSNPLVFFAKCQKSSLAGYSSSKQLSNGLTLHWQAATPSSDQLQLALEAKKGTPAAASWFAVGWSRSGKMGGSNVIVMEEVGSAPGQYDLESDPLYTAKAVAASWSASSYSITEDDKSVVMQFSRGIGEDSSVPVKRSGYSNMIWAYGAGIWEVDGGHDAKGATVVDFSCNGCKGLLRKRC